MVLLRLSPSCPVPFSADAVVATSARKTSPVARAALIGHGLCDEATLTPAPQADDHVSPRQTGAARKSNRQIQQAATRSSS
jgi:hypothetical protein